MLQVAKNVTKLWIRFLNDVVYDFQLGWSLRCYPNTAPLEYVQPRSRVHTQTFPHINDSVRGLAGKCPFHKWFQGYIILLTAVSVQNLNLWTFFWAQHAHSPHNSLYFGQVIHLGCENIECDHCTVLLSGEQLWKAINSLNNMSQYSFMVGLVELHPFLTKNFETSKSAFLWPRCILLENFWPALICDSLTNSSEGQTFMQLEFTQSITKQQC